MAGTYKIMIADDFPILREDLAEVIREQPDMEVVGEASTGKEIVALAENMDYDLILMDIEMETMNAGITATEMIRDKNPQAKIIFLTAHELREIIITAMGAGALDYIVKGCSDEEILYHIRCALEGHPGHAGADPADGDAGVCKTSEKRAEPVVLHQQHFQADGFGAGDHPAFA